jgi:hypothetical protein
MQPRTRSYMASGGARGMAETAESVSTGETYTVRSASTPRMHRLAARMHLIAYVRARSRWSGVQRR